MCFGKYFFGGKHKNDDKKPSSTSPPQAEQQKQKAQMLRLQQQISEMNVQIYVLEEKQNRLDFKIELLNKAKELIETGNERRAMPHIEQAVKLELRKIIQLRRSVLIDKKFQLQHELSNKVMVETMNSINLLFQDTKEYSLPVYKKSSKKDTVVKEIEKKVKYRLESSFQQEINQLFNQISREINHKRRMRNHRNQGVDKKDL